jgi:hypothetical protein
LAFIAAIRSLETFSVNDIVLYIKTTKYL